MTDNAVGQWDTPFRKSSFSGSSGGNCVRIASTGTQFGVRDSKHPAGPVLAVPEEQGHAFLTGVKHDRFSTP
jgi:hypothetical protein